MNCAPSQSAVLTTVDLCVFICFLSEKIKEIPIFRH